MGKRTKKAKKSKKTETSKISRFVQRGANKLFLSLTVLLLPFMLLNLMFMFRISVSVELYFLIIYVTALFFTAFIVFGLWNSMLMDKIWDRKNIQNSLFNWIARIAFLLVLFIDVKLFVFPMTLDLPRIATGHYKEITGTVKSIETNNYTRSSGRGKWYEEIKYVYFTEQTSGKTIKITFHANSADIGYNSKTIYYLPHAKWGIKAE